MSFFHYDAIFIQSPLFLISSLLNFDGI